MSNPQGCGASARRRGSDVVVVAAEVGVRAVILVRAVARVILVGAAPAAGGVLGAGAARKILVAADAGARLMAEQRLDALEEKRAAGDSGRGRRRRAQKPAASRPAHASHK